MSSQVRGCQTSRKLKWIRVTYNTFGNKMTCTVSSHRNRSASERDLRLRPLCLTLAVDKAKQLQLFELEESINQKKYGKIEEACTEWKAMNDFVLLTNRVLPPPFGSFFFFYLASSSQAALMVPYLEKKEILNRQS